MPKVCPKLAHVYLDFNFFCLLFINPKTQVCFLEKKFKIYKFKVNGFRKTDNFKYIVEAKRRKKKFVC